MIKSTKIGYRRKINPDTKSRVSPRQRSRPNKTIQTRESKSTGSLEEAKSRQKETPKDQEEHINVVSRDLSKLINEAKISDQTAQKALEKYNNLRRAANSAVEDFNTRFRGLVTIDFIEIPTIMICLLRADKVVFF